MANLVAPTNEKIIQNGITFDVEYKLSQSRERDWAPYDEILTVIYDDAHMVVSVATTKTAKVAKQFVKDKSRAGLTRSPHSLEILARRSQQTLF